MSAAEVRSQRLLFRYLTSAQRLSWTFRSGFWLRSSMGRFWISGEARKTRFYPNEKGRRLVAANDGICGIASPYGVCVLVRDYDTTNLPAADRALAQKLLIDANVGRFLNLVNFFEII